MKQRPFVIVTAILCVLFLKLVLNYSDTFNDIEKAHKNHSAIILSKGMTSEDDIRKVLKQQNYVEDDSDATLIATQLCDKLNNGQVLTTLYDLQKRVWQVPANVIDSIGGPLLRERLKQSNLDLGIDEGYKKICNNQELFASHRDSIGNGIIKVLVKSENDDASFFSKLINRKYRICPDIIVRLSKHTLDSLNNPHRETVRYLKTNEKGVVEFIGLNTNCSYSVIPICEGFEYGNPKGTVGGSWSECKKDSTLKYEFTQIEHKIRLFDASTLKQIKEDHTIIIRSPEKFKGLLVKYLILFFALWWGLLLWESRKDKYIDSGILSILMLLTGLCLLLMFSINDPLTDALLGIDMAIGVIAGIVMIWLFLKVDFVKLYQDKLIIGFDIPLECIKWIFKPFRVKVKYLTNILSGEYNVLYKIGALLTILVCGILFWFLDVFRLTRLSDRVNAFIDQLPKGFGYLLTGLILTALLWTPLGASVGGMLVNIDLGFLKFQPSEIAKYLIVIFMAAYFSVNATNIVKYSAKGNTSLLGSKLRMLFSVIIGLGILMGMYLKLGDMGPALVIAFTFIILYSIIKSKIDLEGLSEQNQLSRILTCDLAMLVYGIISFIVFLYVGREIGSMGIGCISWFALWIIIGVTKKQIFESPILFNLILSAFIFGGSILSRSDILSLKSIGERLESRNEMCTNTWGTLPVEDIVANAGENTQVAEGLWGLASGGLWGQGLGNGTPNFIPAFDTDMILQSIGEQLGFIGIAVVILSLVLLLRKTIVLGYRTSHPFAFYLCLGIAIVTAVQFVIISLGSTGIIPLTGVTVPFLSRGMVSMILNLMAFGIVLSISKHNVVGEVIDNADVVQLKKKDISKYNYSVSILSWVYCCLSVFISGVFLYYQLFDRDETLIRPAYINNASGIPVVEYNPRIKILMDKLQQGDICDRNGVIIATSDPSKLLFQDDTEYAKHGLVKDDIIELGRKRQQRYYPYGEHLFYILGDYNTQLLFSTEKWARGYMAESRHLSELRGFDDRMKNEHGTIEPALVLSSKYTPNRFLPDTCSIKDTIRRHNYRALVPYLKDGVDGNKVKRYNKRKKGALKPQDIHLTIDAKLQKDLQEAMEIYSGSTERNTRGKIIKWPYIKQRISAVVIDANHGDLLASANYPLPNMDSLRLHAKESYQVVEYSHKGKAYSDMDLGLLFATPPGSSAKIMSALAAFHKMGTAANKSIDIFKKELIADYETRSGYYGADKDMKWAISKSSNVYFVKLVNENNLYPNLLKIYRQVGVSLNQSGPYSLHYADTVAISDFYKKANLINFNDAIEKYHRYQSEHDKKPLIDKTWMLIYGQGVLDATPLAMARTASVAINRGNLAATVYNNKDKKQQIPIIKSISADTLANFMCNQAQQNTTLKGVQYVQNGFVGGKTGTPVREVSSLNRNIEDSWYICYIQSEDKKNNLAVAIRIERASGNGSAIDLFKNELLDIFIDYVNPDNVSR